MGESIMKAAQGIWFVVSDLEQAHAEANGVQRPEGRTVADKALAAYLARLLGVARELQSDLLRIVPTPPGE